MRNIPILIGREMRALFVSPILWVVMVMFLLFNGFSFWLLLEFLSQPMAPEGAPMQYFFGGSVLFWLAVLAMTSIIPMGAIAAELRSGTIETLMTAPVKEWEVVVSKFLACWLFYVALWVPTLVYVVVLRHYGGEGQPDLGPIASGYLGTLLLGGAFLSIGLLMSTVTKNQIVAAVLAFVSYGCLFLVALVSYLPTSGDTTMYTYLNIWAHMDDWGRGIVDTRHIVYSVSIMFFAVFVAIRLLESRRTTGIGYALAGVFGLRSTVATQKGRGDKRSDLASKGQAAGANAAMQIVLAACVLVMVNYLGARHYHRFDWTAQNIYTLSEQTRNVLRTLPRQVEVIVMMSQGDSLYSSTREMLERYGAEAGDRLRVRYIDPDQDPTEFQHVLEQYPINAGITRNQEIVVEQVIVVTAGEANRFVTPNEDFVSGHGGSMMDAGSGQTFNPPRAELALTSAIYRVVSGRRRVICVTSGHGEWSAAGSGDRSLSDLSDHLERYEVELRSVAVGLDRRPDFEDCDALVVAGPTRPFLPEEARLIRDYVIEDGGDLILLIDPIVERDRFVPSGLEDVAREMGVILENAEAVDPRATAPFCGGGHPTAFIAAAQEQPVCISRARPLSLVDDDREGRAFIETISDESFAEVDASQLSDPSRDDDDRAGPLQLGAAVEQENEAARTARLERRREEIEAETPEDQRRGSLVAVVGDSDFLSSDYRQNPRLGNFGLAVGLFNSVADNTVLVAQPPREVERTQLTLTDAQLARTRLIFVFGLPLIAIAAGLSMWWTRRQ